MTITDEELKRLYQAFVKHQAPGGRDHCPQPDKLVSLASSEACLSDKMELIDHITNCSSCAEEFMYLRGVKKDTDRLVKQLERPRAHYPSLYFKYALILLGIGLSLASFLLLTKWKDSPGTLRTQRSAVVLRAPISTHPSSALLLFQWQRFPNADHYVLELYDDDLLPFWTSERLTDTRLIAPNDVVDRFMPGKSFFWMVTAYHQNEKIGESELVVFRIIDQ